MDHKKQRELMKAADEILLEDGRVFYEGTVRGPLMMTHSGNTRVRAQRNRKRKDVIYDAIGRYEALDPADRRLLRKQYQKYNPEKSRLMLDWQHWLVEYFDGTPANAKAANPVDRADRPAIP